MARKSSLKAPKRVNVNFETELHAAAVEKAESLGLSFSEYCARLINRDLPRKGSAAEDVSRHVAKPRRAA